MTSDDGGLEISGAGEALRFWIHVTPRARRAAVGGCFAGALRIAVREPPIAGRANAACARSLAAVLGIARADLELDALARGRRKRVTIRGGGPVLERIRVRLEQLAVDPAVR